MIKRIKLDPLPQERMDWMLLCSSRPHSVVQLSQGVRLGYIMHLYVFPSLSLRSFEVPAGGDRLSTSVKDANNKVSHGHYSIDSALASSLLTVITSQCTKIELLLLIL